MGSAPQVSRIAAGEAIGDRYLATLNVACATEMDCQPRTRGRAQASPSLATDPLTGNTAVKPVKVPEDGPLTRVTALRKACGWDWQGTPHMHPRNCRGLKGVRNAVIGRAESLKHVSKLGIASCLFLLKFRTQGLAVADFSHFTMERTRMHPPLTPLSLRKPTLEPNNSSATFCILLLWNLKAGRLVPAFGYIQCCPHPHQ